MVRLVFRPYTQIGRSICTSESLRSSTRVSSGFDLPRHSSPSFGSQRTRSCATAPTRRVRSAGRAPTPSATPDPTSTGPCRPLPSLRRRVSYGPTTRAFVRLLGPCFKTGREGGRRDHRPRASPGRDARSERASETATGNSNGDARATRSDATPPRERGRTRLRAYLDASPGRAARTL